MRYVTKVAGVTMDGRQAVLAEMRTGQAVRIVPEPDNPWDKNALAVMTSATEKCGYVPREIAAEVAPRLTEACQGRVMEISGGFELEDGTAANLGLVIAFDVPDEEH